MTLEEAKKILKKEIFGIRFKKFDKPLKFEEMLWIRNEKPEVLEALHIVAKNGIGVSVPETALRIRSLIIKKMKAGEGAPDPVSGTPLSAVEGMKLQRKDNKNTDKNPALAEAASQFNDALLDEQGKKIEKLANENERLKDQIAVLDACKKHNDKIDRKQIKCLGKEIARLNKIIHKKNFKIEELRKESSRHLRGKMKMFGENFDLEQELKDKNAVLADVAEELRLSKIREKNLTEVCQKYMKECEELREKVAEKTNLVEIVRKGSKEYCEYGIAAEKMIQKMAKVIVEERAIDSEDFEEYRRLAKGYRFNPQLPERTDEEEKKLNTSKSTLDDLKEEAYNSFNAKAHNLGPVGSKDGNGIIDQMIGVDIAEEGGDHSAIIAQCYKNIAISKDEAEIIERCTKNGTELHYSEKDGFTYTNGFGDEMPIIYLRGMCQVFTDEEIKNMKK